MAESDALRVGTGSPFVDREFILKPNNETVFTYIPREPIRLVLAPGPQEVRLTIGEVEDLIEVNLNLKWLRALGSEFAVIDPRLAEISQSPRGVKGLDRGENVVLGRESLAERFNFSPKVSRRHVLIRRDTLNGMDSLSLTDLASSNGTRVIQRSLRG